MYIQRHIELSDEQRKAYEELKLLAIAKIQDEKVSFNNKLTELLKQKQYSPMTVAQQVISVFCGVKGYLDDIELKDIAEFENKIIEKCKSDKPEIIESIQSSGKLEEDKEKLLVEVISKLKENFKS